MKQHQLKALLAESYSKLSQWSKWTGKNPFTGLRNFLLLWSTQALSGLGSAMTSFALIIWAYQQQGSALTTSLLSVCSYAPYVVLSIFAGAFSDRWDKKRTMLVCDTCAALCTLTTVVLLSNGWLEIWHLYLLNFINGLMNAFQSPASDVAVTLIVPKEQYHRIGGLQSFSNSLVTILTPMLASAVLAFGGMVAVILFDLVSFMLAFLALTFFIKIPSGNGEKGAAAKSILSEVGEGLGWLKKHRGVLDLILFMAVINLICSVYEAALAPMILSRTGGSELALGTVNMFTGIANVAGSILVSFSRPPKSRPRAIFNAITFSMAFENFLLGFGRTLPVWAFGTILGWLAVPILNVNMGVIFREQIPVEMQGRVYSARNTLQFFTIPLGYLLGGLLVDRVFEPLMAGSSGLSRLLSALVGTGKGSGAGVLYLLIGILGIMTCLLFRRDRHIWVLDMKKT